jgi:hypothetical protein
LLIFLNIKKKLLKYFFKSIIRFERFSGFSYISFGKKYTKIFKKIAIFLFVLVLLLTASANDSKMVVQNRKKFKTRE